MPQKALLIVDVQNDFCPKGKLPVPKGAKVIIPLNRYIHYCRKNGFPIFASRDWHPKITKHFKKDGGIWPVHCAQKTKGAQFHPKLKLPKSTTILSKGMDPKKDSYSAFQAYDKKGRLFARILESLHINELFIGGLATDYCVKASVVDARKNKIVVHLLMDAIRGVDIQRGDSVRAIKQMIRAGAKKITLKKLIKPKK